MNLCLGVGNCDGWLASIAVQLMRPANTTRSW